MSTQKKTLRYLVTEIIIAFNCKIAKFSKYLIPLWNETLSFFYLQAIINETIYKTRNYLEDFLVYSYVHALCSHY